MTFLFKKKINTYIMKKEVIIMSYQLSENTMRVIKLVNEEKKSYTKKEIQEMSFGLSFIYLGVQSKKDLNDEQKMFKKNLEDAIKELNEHADDVDVDYFNYMLAKL